MTNLAILFLAVPVAALAGVSVPEIDATTGPAALGLLFGAIMILRGRRKSNATRQVNT